MPAPGTRPTDPAGPPDGDDADDRGRESAKGRVDLEGADDTGPQSMRVPPQVSESTPPPTPRSTLEEIDVAFSSPRKVPSRAAVAGAAASEPDTLISGPRPAEREDLDSGERFRLLEDRVDELEARLRFLERPRVEGSAESRPQPWWIWLIFLLGLAVTWRLLEALR